MNKKKEKHVRIDEEEHDIPPISQSAQDVHHQSS